MTTPRPFLTSLGPRFRPPPVSHHPCSSFFEWLAVSLPFPLGRTKSASDPVCCPFSEPKGPSLCIWLIPLAKVPCGRTRVVTFLVPLLYEMDAPFKGLFFSGRSMLFRPSFINPNKPPVLSPHSPPSRRHLDRWHPPILLGGSCLSFFYPKGYEPRFLTVSFSGYSNLVPVFLFV